MDQRELLELFQQVQNGTCTPDSAVLKCRMEPYEDLGYAKLDLHRGMRQGANEVIYGQGKTPEQIDGIVKTMKQHGIHNILITRMSQLAADLVAVDTELFHDPIARVGIAMPDQTREKVGSVVVASAGTSDMAVCEEAALTAEVLGSQVTRLYDVGVAGLHRLLSHAEELMSARVIIAVAGMEGALPSVIGGLVNCPVIAVPTSVGYGANFNGLSALLSMLNSCASGVSVVNIDNGFGAGFLANRINQMKGVQS